MTAPIHHCADDKGSRREDRLNPHTQVAVIGMIASFARPSAGGMSGCLRLTLCDLDAMILGSQIALLS
jgi:hypothetical protein